MLGVNQAVYTDLVHARKPRVSLQACMQLVYGTETSGRSRSEPVLSAKTAKSRGFFEPKGNSFKLSKICSVSLSVLVLLGNHCLIIAFIFLSCLTSYVSREKTMRAGTGNMF